MNIEVEVTEEGLLKVKSCKYPKGSKLVLELKKGVQEPHEDNGSGESIIDLLKKADQLDIPRRSHEEILRDLREFRETE